jgi:tetratricopeptide (TPR) repeat protein
MPSSAAVTVRRESVILPTYVPDVPDRYPMFLDRRVYQGSSGRVYPLPCTVRIAEQPVPRAWQAVFLENEYVQVMLLPELGGRIHRLLDKTNGYDALYHQAVIKPALVGLAGPWCSGGIEFNWPQHHRPSTTWPTTVAVERERSGAVTVWMSEHDPMSRMKGMHGVRLHPGRSLLELRVRAYNRTVDVQTFLWWANVATRVHAGYQAFFPPDTTVVADHARRALSRFPCSQGHYYGVDYARRGRSGVPAAERPRLFPPVHEGSAGVRAGAEGGIPASRPDDLSWYANIPVPTSYMAVGSSGDFAGGYDHVAGAGLVHVANHHIAPGKKVWTWGNHEFGYAWDRNLTDPDADGVCAPYMELMAGVYTDNQPDFSFLQPGETKAWTQVWYPVRALGPAHAATVDAALHVRLDGRALQVRVAVTARHRAAVVRVETPAGRVASWTRTLAPDRPGCFDLRSRVALRPGEVTVRVLTAEGRTLVCHTPAPPAEGPMPAPAAAPPWPREVVGGDELFLIGQHLEQYRHATRRPEEYWREGLRRDPGDSRCHLALGRWHLRRGEPFEAETHLRASIARQVARNANPYDGEAYYQLGCCLRQQEWLRAADATWPAGAGAPGLAGAYAAFYKATWNEAWQSAGFHALAEIDCWRGDWPAALDHLDRALARNTDHLKARDLKVIVLRRLGRHREAATLLRATLALDPLDAWARALAGRDPGGDAQVRLDLAHDGLRAGLFDDALAWLDSAPAGDPARPDGSLGAEAMVHRTRAWIVHLRGRFAHAAPRPAATLAAVRRHLAAAARARPDYDFPSRLEDIAVLQFAQRVAPRDAGAACALGHLFFDRRRPSEAIALWERAVRLDPGLAVAWRNLGIAYFNVTRQPARARRAYAAARRADPTNARLVYERDQLGQRLGESPAQRLRGLDRERALVEQRDDLALEYGALCLQVGRLEAARAVITGRRFQPWEGGEGLALALHVRTHLALGRRALAAGDARGAVAACTEALAVPAHLGEARHLLSHPCEVHLWLGRALAAAGDQAAARQQWAAAVAMPGGPRSLLSGAEPEQAGFAALALRHLGRPAGARRLLLALLDHARALAAAPATVDYFATSLPTLLLFDDDLAARQRLRARVLEAQALLGLGRTAAGRARLRAVLRRDPGHARAADLLATSLPTP